MTASTPTRPNPELMLKLTHLRGAIGELLLRSGARLNQLRGSLEDPAMADDLLRYHQDLSAQIAEMQVLLDNLRRRGEEAEQVAAEALGTGRLQIECERFEIRELDGIVSTLRRTYDAILYAKAPSLPLDRLFQLEEFQLLVHLTRQEGAFVLHLKSPLVEAYYVPALVEIARAIGMGEKPAGERRVPIGWGAALMQVRRLAGRSVERSELLPERLHESLETIDLQFQDQLSGLADPASLGLPMGCLRTVAELLCELVLNLKERGNVKVLRLSTQYDEILLVDEVGRELRGPDGRPVRDPAREKVDRYVRLEKQE